jgi:hypothetical protein
VRHSGQTLVRRWGIVVDAVAVIAFIGWTWWRERAR